MMNKWIALMGIFWAAHLSAQENKGEYWYDLTAPKGEWNEVFIPNDIIEVLQGNYSPLRIYAMNAGGDTLEVPYVIRNNMPITERSEIDFEIYNESEKNAYQYFTFKTNSEALLDRINLDVEEDDFDHRVLLEGSDDGKEWFTIMKDYRILSIYKDNIKFRYTDLEFKPSRYKYLRLRLPKDLTFQRAYLSGTSEEGGLVQKNKLTWRVEEDEKKKETHVFIKMDDYQGFHSFGIEMNDEVDYFRNSTLYYLKDSLFYNDKWNKNYRKIYSGNLTSVREHLENFHTHYAKELKFVIYNGNNQPLSVKDIEVKRSKFSMVVRFNGDFENHFLSHSDDIRNRVHYDIEKFQNNIPDNLNKLEVGQMRFIPFPNEEKEVFFKSNWWVWGIMIVVILLIGRFTLQMLKEGV